MPYRLSPSDLTFLWDECRRCFYLKVKHNFRRPALPFPSIFTTIDGLMKGFFQDLPTQALEASLPPGRVLLASKKVQSAPIAFAGHSETCVLAGSFDSLLAFDDGSYGLVDFKTAEPKPHHTNFYGRQLHAYTYALEHPAAGHLSLAPISRLGLFIVQPNEMQRQRDGRIAYLGTVTWLEIQRNDAAFLDFLDEVMAVLEAPAPPPPAENCPWCAYRHLARQNPHF